MSSPEKFTPDFQRYLAAKRSVDDRALNRPVWERLASELPSGPEVLEIACGTGTMFARMRAWGLLAGGAAYLGIDADPANIRTARTAGYPGAPAFETADVFRFQPDRAFDLVVSSAFLDLVDLEAALPRIRDFLRPGGLGYFPIHFDGETIFEPAHPMDAQVLAAYHASMEARPTGGHSHTGRRLFRAFPESGFEVLAAGASDWVVHPVRGRYPGDEAYFLRHILHFFEGSCAGVPGLEDWLAVRIGQTAAGQLVFIAHQLDFLVRRSPITFAS